MVPVVEAPEWENMACRFAFEGEGVTFVSGVRGVWIAGKGAADAKLEFGFR